MYDSEKYKKWYRENRPKIIARRKELYQQNKEGIKNKRRKYMKSYYLDNKGKIREYHNNYYSEKNCKERYAKTRKAWADSPRGFLCRYKSKAKQRGIEFNLALEDFENNWQKNCSYCGSDIETVGLDRINNKAGYQADNITPCCRYCNRFKGGLPIDLFLEKIKKIASHLKLVD